MTFFEFPREIRDEVYRQYFSTEYRVPEIMDALLDSTKNLLRYPLDTPQHTNRRNAHRCLKQNILDVSKTLRDEADDFLYRKRTFHFSTPGLCNLISQEAANRLQNVEIHIDMPDYCIDRWLSDPGKHPREDCTEYLMRQFSTPKTQRRNCRVVFHECSLSLDTIDELPLFKSLRTLVGFRDLIIELHTQAYTPEKDRPAYEKRIGMVQIRLESALGPAERSTQPLDPGDTTKQAGQRYCLRFHPREYCEKQSKESRIPCTFSCFALNKCYANGTQGSCKGLALA